MSGNVRVYLGNNWYFVYYPFKRFERIENGVITATLVEPQCLLQRNEELEALHKLVFQYVTAYKGLGECGCQNRDGDVRKQQCEFHRLFDEIRKAVS